MQIIAYQKYEKTTPRKLKLVADVVRDLHPSQALLQLNFMHKLAAKPLAKVLNQAIKNAVNNSGLNEKDLKIKHILIEEAPIYKRWRAASRGRARSIQKRTSHIKVILENIETSAKQNSVLKKTQTTKKTVEDIKTKATKKVIKPAKEIKTDKKVTKK